MRSVSVAREYHLLPAQNWPISVPGMANRYRIESRPESAIWRSWDWAHNYCDYFK